MTDTYAAHRRAFDRAAVDLRGAGAPAVAEFVERVRDLCEETGAILDCDVPTALDELEGLAYALRELTRADR